MKKVLFILFIFGILLFIIIVLLWQPKEQNERIPLPKKIEQPIENIIQYEKPRTLRYGFILKNTSNRLIKKADFWAYAPVKQTASQKVEQIKTSISHELLTDILGNQTLHFLLTNIPPYGSQVINITVELMLANEPNPIEETHQSWFLGEEPFVEISAASLQATAKKLAKKEPLQTSRHIFNWVARHIKYAGYIRENRGALYALREKSGDCTEYMYLFIALARLNGIPARGLGGYVYRDDAFLKPEDYHNWAEFYVDGQWQLADPQNKVFMDKQSDYIAMRIISELSNFNGRFWSSDKKLTVKMNIIHK